MQRAFSARCLHRALRVGDAMPAKGLPLFLCPAIGAVSLNPASAVRRTTIRYSQRRMNHTETTQRQETVEAIQTPTRKLPLACSGCGAFTQTSDENSFGFYNIEAKRVRNWLYPKQIEAKEDEVAEDEVVQGVLASMDSAQLKALGLSEDSLITDKDAAQAVASGKTRPPVCDRCHNLVHHSIAATASKIPMSHPTVETLRETMEESPHKYNHIYHAIDAADFPMSLIPRLNVLLGDVHLRTKNRRSQTKFYKDGKTEMSFIITRADLLGPTKERVDSLMPYLREVLRDTLGRVGGRVRLGNVRCVSAKRGWWTSQLKEEIWSRGGGGWMIGKVNVGKSQLFESVFPKGRMAAAAQDASEANLSAQPGAVDATQDEFYEQATDLGDLLPPARRAANYPDMPLVSSLPGTTASPIRIPFGNGKGELIDLPGLARSDLEFHVKEEHRQSLIMKKRITPEQVSVRAGKSLILGGGLIRIAPRTNDLVFLMYNFTPLKEHLTSNDKATSFQEQTRDFEGLENICLPETAEKIKLAGTFDLCHDVTKLRAGPLTRKNAVGLQVDRLPFRVLAIDIVVEGVGYVEIVAQVRARDLNLVGQPRRDAFREGDEMPREEDSKEEDPFATMAELRRSSDTKTPKKTAEVLQQQEPVEEPRWPAIDVYTPEGKFVESRPPINGWLNNKPRVVESKGRPRKAMKGRKKQDKLLARSR